MAIDGAAWVGFGGVVAGAVLGFASAAAQEAARRRHDRRHQLDQQAREDEIRFEGRRFDAYVAMITAANRVYGAAKYPSSGEAGTGPGPLDLAYEQFNATLSPAFLMATSTATRDSLAALAAAVRDLRNGVSDGIADGDRHGPDPLFRAHRQAIRAAEATMRDEFGLVPLD